MSLFRLRIGLQSAATLGVGGAFGYLVQGRVPQADDYQITGFAPGVHRIHVEVGQRLHERIERILGIILRSKETFLLGRDAQKENRPLRRGGQPGIGAGQLQKPCTAGGVVARTVEDLVPFQGRIFAEMIPMRGINDVLIAQMWIAAFHFRDYVPGANLADFGVDIERPSRV